MKGNEKIIKMINQKFSEIRCRKYNRLLMKGDVLQIEIKCPKCAHIKKLRADRVLGGGNPRTERRKISSFAGI